jgi:hypothetical protein
MGFVPMKSFAAPPVLCHNISSLLLLHLCVVVLLLSCFYVSFMLRSSTYIKLLSNSQLCAAVHTHGTISRMCGSTGNSQMKAEWSLFTASVCSDSVFQQNIKYTHIKGLFEAHMA